MLVTVNDTHVELRLQYSVVQCALVQLLGGEQVGCVLQVFLCALLFRGQQCSIGLCSARGAHVQRQRHVRTSPVTKSQQSLCDAIIHITTDFRFHEFFKC